MHTKEGLIDAFCRIGLAAGDVVLVHSSLRKLGPVAGGADTVLDALLELLGPQGTLALPTHTFKVVDEQRPFDVRHTKGNVGVLSEVFRMRLGVVRGVHPTHSVAALGARAEEFVHVAFGDTSPCSANSPYSRLCDWDGKVLIIGETLNRCTLFHGCEEWAGLDILGEPKPLTCIDAAGVTHPFPMRGHTINTWDQFPRLEPALLERRHLRHEVLGDCPLRLLHARPACTWLVEELTKDRSIIMPLERQL